ncbi:beta-galactosidase small subunit-related protein, partial [Streptomyces sp. NPDC001999]
PPSLHEYKAVVQPVRFTFDGDELAITNLRHSADTSDLRFRWRVEHDGTLVDSGDMEVPVVAAGASARVPLPQIPVSQDSETWLTIDAVLAAGTAWARDGHVIATAQLDRSTRRPAPGVRPQTNWRQSDGTLTLGVAEFIDGSLVRLAGRAVAGPRLELFRPPTDNDEGASEDVDESDAAIAGVSNAELWHRDGLDRLTSRRVSVERTAKALRTIARVSAANSSLSVIVESVWSLEGDELELRVEIEPSSGWLTVWPRIGIRFDLPDGAAPIDGAEWFGLGPLESYPDSLRAARTGRFTSTVRDLSVDYARPQETGHRSQLRQLALTSGSTKVLHIVAFPDTRGRRPGFTLSRHTPQQIARAGHPFELPDSTTSHLIVDAAQHGLGSRACGPDVWPEFALRPESRTIRLRMAAGRGLSRNP